MRRAAPLAAALLLAPAAAAAEEHRAPEPRPEARRPRPRSLSFHVALATPAAILGVAGAGAWIGVEAVGAPTACGWCTKDTTELDRAVRRALGKPETNALGRPPSIAGPVSDVFLVAQALVPFFHLAGSIGEVGRVDGGVWRDWGLDTAVMLEATALSIGVNALVKQAVARERPYVQTLPAGTPHDEDHFVSFFSGHTSTAFAMGVSSAMIASLRGYRLAPLWWGAGLGVSALTGWLRIANDSHWTTDVLTGALIGSAIGVAIPLLHHPSLGRRSPVKGLYGAPVAGGATLGVTGDI